MIFVRALKEPALFVMLSEKDVTNIREGRTVFVDQRALKGALFDRVIISLSPTDEHSLALLEQAGNTLPPQLAVHGPAAHETPCAGCGGLIETAMLFEGKCIVCWATQAKKGA